jgi:uncharacterized membrane protein
MARSNPASDVADTATGAPQEATDTAKEAGDAGKDAAQKSTDGLFSQLMETAKDAALAALKPAVQSAAQSAATYAADKGPDMVKDKLGSKLEDVGGVEGLADRALSNAGPLGKVASTLGVGGKLVGGLTGDDDEEESQESDLDATGSGRRMPVQQAMDVAVPLEFAYHQWTQFEEYPNFMHRVDSASQEDDAHVKFEEKVWGFGRSFEAEIVEQRPYERITWRSVSGLQHAGVVTFHRLADRLTHIEVTVDFKPESLFQKFARGARFSKRAIRADMHRFKAYTELLDQEDGSWLGRIEDGEVVQDDAEVRAEMESEGEAGEDAEAEEQQPTAEEEPEETAEAEEEEPEAEEEEPGAEEEQAPRRRPRRKAAASDGGGARQARARGGQASRSSNGHSRKRPQRPRKPRATRS